MKKQIFLIVIIFTVFCYFRLYNIGNRVSFGWDQEQFTYQVKQLVKDHRPVLLGPRANNDRGFFLAPYFTYLVTPFYLLTNLHPKALMYFIFFYDLLFFIVCLLFLKKIFGFAHSLFFLALWSINPMIARYDFIPRWPMLIPIGTVIVWKILKDLELKKSILNWITLGIILGFFINMHIQFAFIVLFSLFFIVFDRVKIKLTIKKIATMIGSFILMFSPLLIFDLRHDFLNTKLLLNFFKSGIGTLESSPTSWLPVFANIVQPLIYFKSIPVIILFYLAITLIIIFLIKNKKNYLKSFYLSTLVLWFIFPLIFAKYGQRPSEYYFVFIMPFIYMIIIDFVLTIKKSWFLYIFTILLFTFNFNKLRENLKSENLSLIYRDKLIKDLAKITKKKKFNISYTVPLGRDTGFKYLIEYYGIKQTGNWSDPLIQIKIPVDNNCLIKEGDIGVIIPKELR